METTPPNGAIHELAGSKTFNAEKGSDNQESGSQEKIIETFEKVDFRPWMICKKVARRKSVPRTSSKDAPVGAGKRQGGGAQHIVAETNHQRKCYTTKRQKCYTTRRQNVFAFNAQPAKQVTSQ